MINNTLGRDDRMFCYQCQETAHGTGCTIRGICGKNDEVACLQDDLLEETARLAFVATWLKDEGRNAGSETDSMITENLFITITNVNYDGAAIKRQIRETERRTRQLRDMVRSKRSLDKALKEGEKTCYAAEDDRSLHSLITFGLKGLAAYVYHARALGESITEIDDFIQATLSDLYECRLPSGELLELVLTVGQYGLMAMELLDLANTGKYGDPELTKIKFDTAAGPGILISGHDLGDLEQLLKQTEGTGVKVYTHGEMMPALAYPMFKKYMHLVGNYGGAWHEQLKDFTDFGGPIVMTSNCLVPPSEEYAHRLYVTGPVGYPGCKVIPETDGVKDFSQVIEHAKAAPPPLRQGDREGYIGFAYGQGAELAPEIVEAVKRGDISRFVVMAGCDGRMNIRDYYAEYARKLPKDAVILTAGCAKFRYNRLGLEGIPIGSNGELMVPKVLDAGQCNDSFSLIKIARDLQTAFDLKDINDLPVTYNIAWYEQKAVIVLLALLSLGIRDIQVGPTLPAFLSPGVLKVLEENYGLGCPLG